MKKLLWAFLVLIGCASGTKVEYTEWKTDRFLVTYVNTSAVLQTWENGKLIRIERPVGDFKLGQEVAITYRKKTETICTDQNCTRTETYEVK